MTKTDQHERCALSRLLTTSSVVALSLGALSLGALAFGTLAAGPAVAQTVPPAATAAANTDASLATVTVTAERRVEDQKDVPVSVSALSGLTLDTLSSGGPDIRFLAARVPSLQIESSFGRTFPRFYIRGLGNSDFDLNASQPVSIVYNDVVEENPILKGFPIFDVDQVEVLRGPQGTLFGRNTPAGVVKVDSAKPTDQSEGYVELSYGRFNSLDLDGAVGGAIVPGKLDFRASFYLARQDDWVHNTFVDPVRSDLGGYVDGAGRLQLKFMPTDDLTALLDVHFRVLDGTAAIFYGSAIEPGTNHLVPGFNPDTVSLNGGNYQRLHTGGSSLTLTETLKDVTLTSVTGFERGYVASRGDVDGGNPVNSLVGPPPPFQVDTSDSVPLLNQLTQEVRYASNDWGPWSNIGGIFYFHETAHINDYDYGNDEPYTAPYGEGGLDGVAYQKQTTDSVGIYETAKYQVTDQWNFGAGIRWSYDAKEYSVNVAESAAFPPAAPTKLSTNPTSSNVSWDVNSVYAIDQDVSVYARIATGYRGPSIQGRVLSESIPIVSEASPETTISYEAGIKTSLFDNKLRWNIDGFAWDTDNLQLTATGGAGNFTELVNAKKAEGYGFETDITAKPIPQLLLTASASYNHTQIDDPNLAVAPCGSGCIVTDPLVTRHGATLALLNGNALPEAPQWIVDWDVRYSIPFEDGTEAYIDTDWSYRSQINTLLYTSVEFTGPPLLLGGVRVGYIQPDQNWEIAGYVRNITNTVKEIGAIDFDTLTALVNDPRTYGVQAIYHFGGPVTPSPEVPAAIPAPPPAPAPVAKAPEAQRSFQVFFDFDKSNITEAAAHVIQAAADAVKAGNVVQITVTGHTDTVGSAKYNQALSERRAAAVKAGLVSDGVSGSEITTLGVGKTGLLVPTADGVREPQNRRAEIVLQ